MEGNIFDTEVRTSVHDNGIVATLVAFYNPDDERLVATRHPDGHVTIRIGRGGAGPRKELTPEAAQALAAVLVAPAKEAK